MACAAPRRGESSAEKEGPGPTRGRRRQPDNRTLVVGPGGGGVSCVCQCPVRYDKFVRLLLVGRLRFVWRRFAAPASPPHTRRSLSRLSFRHFSERNSAVLGPRRWPCQSDCVDRYLRTRTVGSQQGGQTDER